MLHLRMASLALLALVFTACGKDEPHPPTPPAPPPPVAEDNRTQRVTDLFIHLDEGKQPGAAVLVVENDQVIYSRGFGYADLANNVRVTPESTFRLASVSKQFTATGLLVLAERGDVNIDKPLTDYLAEQTAYPGVTLRHLLNHTSGIPDYYDILEPAETLLSNADIADYLAKMDGPDFVPGERYEYSNSAYELMAQVIEKVSGMPFAEFMRENVFRPAGMHGALIHDHTEPEIANRVYGYDTTAGGYELNDSHFLNGITGSGGMYATLNDFYAWDQALDNGDVITAPTLVRAYRKAKLNDGGEINYGFGWRLDSYAGHDRAAHGGSWVGFRTGIARYPEQNLSIVVLTNNSSYEPGLYIDRISDIYLPKTDDEFRASSTHDQIQRQQRRLPPDDIWWTVNGRDMLWNFKNLHQLFPTVNVYRNGPIRELASEPNDAIAEFVVETPDGDMSFDDFIHSEQSTMMGIVVLHQGKIVYERYPRMYDYEMPVYWSVAKAFVGTIVRILEERGEIDVDEPIEWYIPEMQGSAFAGTSIRDILDMASGLDCADEYEDKTSCYYLYSMAIGDGFRLPGAPDNAHDFVATLEAERLDEAGQKFSYSGVNTFVLAWLVEKVTGLAFQDVFTREVWYHIGAESNASYIAPRYGVAVTHGGFMARLRDVARFGLLFTPSYAVVSERKIISDEHIEFLWSGGRPELLTNAGMPETSVSGVKHNIYQWDTIFANGDYFKGGWAGQGLLINPQRDVVVVFTGYFKDDNYSEVDAFPRIRKMLDAVFASEPE